MPNTVNIEPIAMVIPIDVAAAAMAPRGIQRSSLRVSGHGIAARCAVTECDPIAQSKRKNKMLITGTKKSTTSQSGFPASRSRWTVNVTPNQMNGSDKTSSAPTNARVSEGMAFRRASGPKGRQ